MTLALLIFVPLGLVVAGLILRDTGREYLTGARNVIARKEEL